MGAQFGVAAKGKNGEVIFNHVADLEVPATVRNGVKKAMNAAKKAGGKTSDAVGHGVKGAAKQVKNELSKAGAELSQFGVVDLESQIKPDEQSAIVGFLKDSVRKKMGEVDMGDVPDVHGHSKFGGSTSNSNINAALKFVGGGAFLPTEGSTGVYVYVDDKTNRLSGFAASIKWTLD